MNRRSFLRAAGAAAALAAIPTTLKALAPAEPILYGDGVHDDAPALQALLDRAATIPPGNYMLGAPLVIRRDNVELRDCTLHGIEFGDDAAGCECYDNVFKAAAGG